MVMVKDREEIFNDMTISIRVQEISSLVVQDSYKLQNLQIDSDSTLDIVFLDAFGR